VRWRQADTVHAPERAADSGGEAPTALRSRLDHLPAGHPSAPEYRRSLSPDNSWRQSMAGFAAEWRQYQERWPHRHDKTERRKLDPTVERALELGCDKIQAAEPEITDRLRAVEAAKPGRILTGLEFCLKGRERVIDKATKYMREMPDFTPAQALAMVPDPVRYTFTYETDEYSEGVVSDLDRIEAAGFEMIKLKNFWNDDEYRGINSQWRDSETNHRFEIQFHTAMSFEAKQLTHGAYERLRESDLTDNEELELQDFQRRVTARIYCPTGAAGIPERG
jgi:hypothetical protein